MRRDLPPKALTVIFLVVACSSSDGDNDSNAIGTPCIDGQYCQSGFECVAGYCLPSGQETDGGDGDPGDGDPGDGDPGDGDPGDGDGDPGDGDGDSGGDGDGDGDSGGDGDGDSGGDGDGDGDVCVPEVQCANKRVALTFVVSYGSYLNSAWDNTTRWEQLALSLENLPADTQAMLEQDAIVSLIRFGHDPNPNNPGTSVVDDSSGIIDGQGYDVSWSDCNWPDLVDAIDAAGPPMNGNVFGMGSWMNGGMELALAEIVGAQPMPANVGREYRVIIITDGRWSNQDGTMVNTPPSDSPTPTVATLYQTYDVPTYVVAFPIGQSETNFANGLAAVGGTNSAFVANSANALEAALTGAIEAAVGNESCD